VTSIEFHTHLEDKSLYACRLLRKAVGMNNRVGVVGPADELQALNERLWTFSAHDFLPHVHIISTDATQSLQARMSGIWLVEDASVLHADHLVLHLGQGVHDGFQRFTRWIELVGLSEAEQGSARQRWKHYRDRGYTLTHHDRSK
jgi:DNA polymerase III subunit chi